jgi:hypothetical protein
MTQKHDAGEDRNIGQVVHRYIRRQQKGMKANTILIRTFWEGMRSERRHGRL